MNKRLVGTVVAVLALVSFGTVLYAQIDPVEILSGLLPADCVTQEDMFQVINALIGDCVDDPNATVEDIVAAFKDNGLLPKGFVYEADACVTKGLLSQIFYRALNLRPTVAEWLRIATGGLDPVTATNVAQRHCVMVTGEADEALTGREFAACIIALLNFELEHERLACGRFGYHFGRLSNWLNEILATIMSESEAATYIPCLIIVPTS